MATDYKEARALMLGSVLPASSDRYVALWLGDPINGGAEITLTGYARVPFQDWTTVDNMGESERTNALPISFPTITENGAADFWSIHDAATEPSTLLRSGPLLDDLDQPISIVLTGGGDDVQFNANALRIGIREEI